MLLTRSHMCIGEIAALLHFCDDNNFSSAFNKYHGMTSCEYRKALKEGGATVSAQRDTFSPEANRMLNYS